MAVLLRDRAAPLRRIADEDQGAGGRVDLLVAEGEGRRPREDDVQLLLPGCAEADLVVLADDVPLATARFARIPKARMSK